MYTPPDRFNKESPDPLKPPPVRYINEDQSPRTFVIDPLRAYFCGIITAGLVIYLASL